MKKLFIVLAVASLGFVACNNDASTGAATSDSARIADSIRVADSTAAVAAAAAAADAAKATADSLHKDSVSKGLIKE